MFYIEKNKKNEFIFHLKSDDNHTIASSEPFVDLEQAKREIKRISKNTKVDRIFERMTNKEGLFYFNILGSNFQKTAESQLYNTKVGLENGIKAAKQFAKKTEIKISY